MSVRYFGAMTAGRARPPIRLAPARTKRAPARSRRAPLAPIAVPVEVCPIVVRPAPSCCPHRGAAFARGWVLRWRDLPPSQNELMRRYRNRHKYDQLLASWEKVIADLMMVGRIPKAGGRRRLEIVRYVREEKYRLDRGNLVGGCKPVLDAAVRCGLIVDDREEHLDDYYRQVIDPDERVELYVCDL